MFFFDRFDTIAAAQRLSLVGQMINADFGTRVFGMQLDGNFGVRYQRIKVNAQPVIDFNKRSFVQGATTGGTPTYIVTNTFLERTIGNVQRTSEDWLPSLNLALWPIDEKLGLRYSIALQRARPSMGELTGSGTVQCGLVSEADRAALEAIIANNPGAVADDDPTTGDGDESSALLSQFTSRCTGRIGNPELKGYGATTQNLSLEWYPNRDTQLSAAVYTINVRSGGWSTNRGAPGFRPAARRRAGRPGARRRRWRRCLWPAGCGRGARRESRCRR